MVGEGEMGVVRGVAGRREDKRGEGLMGGEADLGGLVENGGKGEKGGEGEERG